MAEQNLHLMFCVTQTVNGKWVALVGFESGADAERAASSLELTNVSVRLTHKDRGLELDTSLERASVL